MRLLVPFKPRVKGGAVITAVADSPGQALYWTLVSYNLGTDEEGAPLGSLRWNHTKADKSGLSCNIYMGPTTALPNNTPVIGGSIEVALPLPQGEIYIEPMWLEGQFVHFPLKPGSITLTVTDLQSGSPVVTVYHDDGEGWFPVSPENPNVVWGMIHYQTGEFYCSTSYVAGSIIADYSYGANLIDRVKVKRANA